MQLYNITGKWHRTITDYFRCHLRASVALMSPSPACYASFEHHSNIVPSFSEAVGHSFGECQTCFVSAKCRGMPGSFRRGLLFPLSCQATPAGTYVLHKRCGQTITCPLAHLRPYINSTPPRNYESFHLSFSMMIPFRFRVYPAARPLSMYYALFGGLQ